MTAHQVLRMFFKPITDPNKPPQQDAVSFTAEVNRRAAARGEKPKVPDWMFKGIERK